MGVKNNGTGQTKADLLLTKVDRVAQQNRTLNALVEQLARQNQTVVAQIAQQSNSVSAHVARIAQVNDSVNKQVARFASQEKTAAARYNSLAAQGKELDKKVQEVIDSAIDRDMDREAIMLKVEAVKKELVEELGYLSAQIQSMYRDAAKQLAAPEIKIDYDELASKVAEKLTLPAAEIDYDYLAAEVAKRIPAHELAVDYDELGAKVVENMYIPQALVEDLDYDVLAKKLASQLPEVRAAIDYDELGAKVVENMYIPEAIVEDLDYDALAEKLADKVTVPAPEAVVTDYEALADSVARRLYIPQAIVEELDYDALAKKLAENLPAEEVISADYIASKVAEQIVDGTLDEQAVADKVCEALEGKLPAAAVVDEEAVAEKVCELLEGKLPAAVIDEQAVADKVAEVLEGKQLSAAVDEQALADAIAAKVVVGVDNDEIADRVAKQVGTIAPEQFDVMVDEDGCDSLAKAVEGKLDYDAISSAVAERLVSAVAANDVDSEEIARIVSEKLNVGQINEDALAEKAAAVLSNYLPDIDADEIAEKVAQSIPAAEVDSEAIAACVVSGLMDAQKDADYDIVIDEEGLGKISSAICDSIKEEAAVDRDIVVDEEGAGAIGAAVAAKLAEAESEPAVTEEDIDKIAQKVREGVAEDLKGELAADRDIVVDEEGMNKVAESVAQGYEVYFRKIEEDIAQLKALAAAPAEEPSEPAEEREEQIDIVLDEEGVDQITDTVAQKVSGEYDERLEEISRQLEELKALLAAGVVVSAASDEIAPAQAAVVEEEAEETAEEAAEEAPAEETEEAAEEVVEEAPAEEIEEVAEEAAEEAPAEETEEVAEEAAEEAPAEETEEVAEEAAEEAPAEETEEVAEEAAEETPAEETEEAAEDEEELVTVSDVVDEAAEESAEEDGDMGSIVEEINETPAEGEVMPDGIPGISSPAVDFANMMKYNRSFIARIIQSTDEQKTFYGQVKNALLAYKKVNSNISWGAERFNKGRETIARFKIRGKTLCLYLALDPNEFATSVYHQVDVSDNKSMHGTPMMVKIKSPRGVKKAIRLIDIMLERRNGVKREIAERDYAAMYPYETIEELIEEGLVKDVSKK